VAETNEKRGEKNVERARQEQGIDRDGKKEKGGKTTKTSECMEERKKQRRQKKKHRGEETYSQSN